MGVFDRFRDIMSSNVNALLDKAEDPAKMVDQYLRNARRDLAEVRKETAAVMSAEKRSLGDLEKKRAEVNELTNYAKKALEAGNREDAGVFITKKQTAESGLPQYEEIYATNKANADQMRDMHNKLVQDISTLESRKDMMKAKIASTKARATVNKMSTGSGRSGSALNKMSEMESKVDQAFHTTMSESELIKEPVDEVAGLISKYGSGNSISVEDELAKLEAEMNK